MTILQPGPAPGQEALLREAPCDCDHEVIEGLTKVVTKFGIATSNSLECALGPATAIALAAATLVNPANSSLETRANAAKASRLFADVLEEIARGVRKRAGQ